jgi:2-polyprenyl-6-methoxyphenol hydroxylase-like FAD-dependent oxidoreductase
MNTTTSSDSQVLVVGAGPTGLVLAAQLLARGIRTRIIDKGAGPVPQQSRALGVQARTLEVLDVMGLADAFVERGHRVRRFRVYSGQKSLFVLDFARNGSPYGFALTLPQHETEMLLRARILELGGIFEQGVELVRVAEDGSAVKATFRDLAGVDIETKSDYVVGCDGAHSRVRHELGLAFDGQPYAQDWLLADVALNGAGSEDEISMFLRPDGLPLICIPLREQRWRVVMPNAGDRAGRSPSLEEIQELVDQRAPRRIVVSDPVWLACFRSQLRSTTTYRRGRILLAGDAVHVHSPAGGQGMNTGIMDAHNLAWKLALVAEGSASDRLLDSYEQERRPVAGNVLGLSDAIVRWETMSHPVKRALRDAFIPAVTRLPAVQRVATQRLSQISVAYPSSPLNQPDQGRRGPKPGGRMPDIEVLSKYGKLRLYEVLGRGRHVLLVSAHDVRRRLESAGLSAYNEFLEVVVGGFSTDRHQKSRHGTFAVVRPDGFLAARGVGNDLERVMDYLRLLFGAGAPKQDREPSLPLSSLAARVSA